MARKKAEPKSSEDRKRFPGFDVPRQNWFKMPNIWTDITTDMRSLAELKVVEYVLRHTWGFQEYDIVKRITLDEFEHGRRKVDGSRMDKGIGMRRQAIISGIRQAIEDGFLIEIVDDSDKGRIKKYYGLNMIDRQQQGYEDHTSGVRNSYSSGVGITPRTEKETIERNNKKEVGVVSQLIDYNIEPSKAHDLASKYSPTLISQKIEFLEWSLAKKSGRPIQDPAGWLVRTIEQDFKPPPSFYKQKQIQTIIEGSPGRQMTLHDQVMAAYDIPDSLYEIWERVLETVKEQFAKVDFDTWVKSSYLLSVEHSIARVGLVNWG